MASKKEYEIAFKLGAKLNKNYTASFKQAEEIANKTASNIFKTAAKIAGTVISANAIKDTVKTAMEVETTMAGVAKVVDGLKDSNGQLTDSYYQIKDEIVDLTRHIPLTVSELGEIAASAGQAGIAREELTKFTEDAAKMGVAFDISAEQAGSWMANWRTAFNLTQTEVNVLADQINYLGNNSTQTAADIGEVVNRVGNLGQVAGISNSDVAALSASLVGVAPEVASTGLNNFFVTLSKGASVTKQQQEAFKELGFNSTELARQMQTDSKGVILEVLNSISALDNADQTGMITRLFGSGGANIDAISQLVSNTEMLEENFERVADTELFGGSMLNEFETMSNTTANQFKLIDNAASELKLTIGEELLPYVSEGASMLHSTLINVIDKVPFIISNITRTISNLWNTAKPFFNWVMENPDLIATFFTGIGTSIATFKVTSGVKSVTSSLKGLFGTVMSNPAIFGLGAAASAIGMIGYKVYDTNKKLKQQNLKEHFGDIALSMKDIENVAGQIVRTNHLGAVQSSLMEFEKLEGIQSSISGLVDNIDKYNWKVSVGLELSEDEKENYQRDITSYIDETQNLLTQKQYAVQTSVSLFTDDTIEGQQTRDKFNTFFESNRKELELLGTQLQETVNTAFEDGFLDIDEQKAISELQGKMAAITESMAKSQFDAKLEVMGMGYAGTNLDDESYMELQNKINDEVSSAKESYDEALMLNIAQAKAMLEQDEKYSIDDYDSDVAKFKSSYLKNVGELEGRAADFQVNTLLEAYKDEMETVAPDIQNILQDSVNLAYKDLENNGEIQAGKVFSDILLSGVQDYKWEDKHSKKNVEKMFNDLSPMLEELKGLAEQYNEVGAEIPESISKSLLDIYSIGAVVGDAESIYAIAGSYMSKDNPEYINLLNELQENGGNIPEEFIAGIEYKYPDIENCGIEAIGIWLDAAEQECAKGINADIPLNITMTGNINGIGKIPAFATGTNYTPDTFIAGEDGPELITNGEGRKVFTSLETGRILSNMQSNLSKPSRLSINQSGSVNSAEPVNIEYSPHITVNGSGDSTDIKAAITRALDEDRPNLINLITEVVSSIESRKARLSNV